MDEEEHEYIFTLQPTSTDTRAIKRQLLPAVQDPAPRLAPIPNSASAENRVVVALPPSSSRTQYFDEPNDSSAERTVTLSAQVNSSTHSLGSADLHGQSTFATHVTSVSAKPAMTLLSSDHTIPSTFAPSAEHVTASYEPILPDIFNVSGPMGPPVPIQ